MKASHSKESRQSLREITLITPTVLAAIDKKLVTARLTRFSEHSCTKLAKNDFSILSRHF
jgi:hypothetical protein